MVLNSGGNDPNEKGGDDYVDINVPEGETIGDAVESTAVDPYGNVVDFNETSSDPPVLDGDAADSNIQADVTYEPSSYGTSSPYV